MWVCENHQYEQFVFWKKKKHVCRFLFVVCVCMCFDLIPKIFMWCDNKFHSMQFLLAVKLKPPRAIIKSWKSNLQKVDFIDSSLSSTIINSNQTTTNDRRYLYINIYLHSPLNKGQQIRKYQSVELVEFNRSNVKCKSLWWFGQTTQFKRIFQIIAQM